MGMPVAEMLSRISSHELSEWIAYAQVAPFGEERADLRAGIIASTVANANRDPKKRRKPFEPREFMPSFDFGQSSPSAQEKSPQEIYGMFRMWARLNQRSPSTTLRSAQDDNDEHQG